jgi:multidrug efflux pump subunit AcrA (membrane-fusion protein)
MVKREGDRADAGEVIAELDPATYESALALAEARRGAAVVPPASRGAMLVAQAWPMAVIALVTLTTAWIAVRRAVT